ncbi:UNVERIFIED_CONTAM: Calcium-binding protein CAST [Sesamum angustifolium]|uniref:Calcium-binding protein CAST n=1 Tax=Sesamum angustifolium TaxID=2727405 RepID=A0AAW2IK95_9LAMI
MEPDTAQRNPTIVDGRSSFRLRSPSLNSVRLRRIFDIFDKNHDNIISVDELGQALALLGLQADLSELNPWSSHAPAVDGDGDGDGDDESDLSEAFKVFDEDGDGYISARELQIVLAKLGLQEGREIGSVEMMISSVDQNQDGRVDFFEFKDMMRSVSLPMY